MQPGQHGDPQPATPNDPPPKDHRPGTATEDVLRLFLAGANAATIRECLGIPPSRLRRIVNSPTFRNAVRLERQVADMQASPGGRPGGGCDCLGCPPAGD